MRCQNRFSLGAVYMTEKVPYEKLFKEADSVLYEVKTRGKKQFLDSENLKNDIK